jgi:hypothetical protein
MRKNMRKRLFVDSKVQGELLRRCICHWVIFGLATLVLLLPLHYLVNDVGRPPSIGLRSAWNHYKLLIPVVLVVLPALLYDLLRLSHRFAGPITRLRSEIRRAARGERTEPIHFRENDFWLGLAEDFNTLLARLERQEGDHESHSDEDSDAKEDESRSGEPEAYDSISVAAGTNS